VRIAISGWFSGQPVGSGQYTDRLVAALRANAGSGDQVAVVAPGGHGWPAKLAFEQVVFPRAARDADVAHVPYWAPPLRPTAPTVVTVHDLIPLVLPEYRARAAVRLYTALAARASSRAAAILADSEHTAADVRRRLDADPSCVRVVPLGVDARFRPLEGGVARSALAGFGLPERYGLYVGGFDVRKDLATLFAAWRRVFAATGVPLVVAGALPRPDDQLSPHPAELARTAGLPEAGLRLVGPVADDTLPGLYAGAAVFAYPSRYEGFGLPPLEALACGVPVVAADATSLPEVVGDAGLLVAPGEPEAWADALCAVLEDAALASRLREAGPRRAAGFTWARTAAATRAVYVEVAG